MPKSQNGGPSLLDTIGSTPLIRIGGDGPLRIWGKLESFNPGGSAKDRTARALVKAAEEEGLVYPGATVVESSSGNLGAALAREAAVGGWDFHCVVDTRTNKATMAYMEALGAVLHKVTEPDPETDDWLAARRAKVAELVEELGAVNLDQYSNRAAFTAHSEGTMREIVDQLGRAPDYLVVAVSTTGTVGGCMRYLREHGHSTTVIAVDAEGSVLFGGSRANRLLPGFGAGVVPDLAAEVEPHEVVRVSASDTVLAARTMAAETGFLPGASGGAVAWCVDKLAQRLNGEDTDVVAIFHDAGNAYLDTVYNDEWVGENLGVECGG